MLADLFYLSVIWLVLGFIPLLALGTYIHRNGFLSSLLYLALLLMVGDLISLGWFGGDLGLIASASLFMLVVGIVFILMLKDWNAIGQIFFLFSI